MVSGEVGSRSRKHTNKGVIEKYLYWDEKLGKFFRYFQGGNTKNEIDGSIRLIRVNNSNSPHVVINKILVDILYVSYIYHFDKEIKDSEIVVPIDGNYKNYRPENLKLTLRGQHQIGCKGQSNRTKLPIGIYRSGKKYKATIACRGDFFYLGTYDTVAEASVVVKKHQDELRETGSTYAIVKGKSRLVRYKGV
jgi:hypothetical protein